MSEQRSPHQERLHQPERGDALGRGGEGRVPGAELPAALYASLIAAFGAVLLVSWWAFGGGDDSNLSLAMATVLGLVFFVLPVLSYRTAARRCGASCTPLEAFLRAGVDTATGPLSGRHAWLQILIIPAALVLAALLIGIVAASMAS